MMKRVLRVWTQRGNGKDYAVSGWSNQNALLDRKSLKRHGITSSASRRRFKLLLVPYGAIGELKIVSIGCWILLFEKMILVSVQGMLTIIWLFCVILPSISYDRKKRQRSASKPNGSKLAGAMSTCSKF